MRTLLFRMTTLLFRMTTQDENSFVQDENSFSKASAKEVSDALVDVAYEGGGFLAELFVEGRGGFCGYGFFEGLAFLF